MTDFENLDGVAVTPGTPTEVTPSADWLTDITTARNNAAAQLAAITVSPKPSYNVGGQSYSWGEYLAYLQALIDSCNRQLQANDPCEVVTQGYT